MGVDAVAMVENSRNLSLSEFIHAMEEDEWGKLSISTFSVETAEPDYTSWIDFEWEGNKYFSLRSGAPRYRRLIPVEYDFESEKYSGNPDYDPDIQIPFLKIMRAAEKIAGGPVHLGNDVVWGQEPAEEIDEDDLFFLPPRIDDMIDNWKEIADTE